MSLPKPQFAADVEQWPFDLDWIPDSAYLVGGYVRDLLRGRSPSYLDLDFVLPDRSVEIARTIAHHHQAGFVLLDEARQIARVVFPNATADFAQQIGNSLTDDLMRRDFTVNAIALNPHTQDLCDSTGGLQDLQQGVMRMIAPENFRDDPLRLLRAYRQAAQLGFDLEAQTQDTIRQLAPLLQQVSAERVRVELGYLLSTAQGTPWLRRLGRDKLLSSWFPHATSEGLEQLGAIDQAITTLGDTWPALLPLLQKPLSDRAQGNEAAQRTLISMTKLLGLLPDNVMQGKQTLSRLKYARMDMNLVLSLLQNWQNIAGRSLEQLSRREQYFLFKQAGDAFPAVVLWLMAKAYPTESLQPLVTAYLNPEDPVAHPQPLVSGKMLMTALDLSPGPQVGELLAALEVAQADGKIDSSASALALAQVWQAQQMFGERT